MGVSLFPACPSPPGDRAALGAAHMIRMRGKEEGPFVLFVCERNHTLDDEGREIGEEDNKGNDTKRGGGSPEGMKSHGDGVRQSLEAEST